MNQIKVRNIFSAVFDKKVLGPLLKVLVKNQVKFWGTEGTVKYLKSKGFDAHSVVSGFDFDGRLKSLDKKVFARVLADRANKKHLEELRNVIARSPSTSLRTTKQSKDRHVELDSTRDDMEQGWEPFDAVIVDLYPHNKNNFPESMDIGGQALIRAAIKNYKGVAVAFDVSSLAGLVGELGRNNGSTTFAFRRLQAQKAAKFIAERTKEESKLV